MFPGKIWKELIVLFGYDLKLGLQFDGYSKNPWV